jgi:hypothetical protein
VTGDGYSLVEMKSDPIANNFAFIEHDLAIINADHGPELVIEELVPAVFDIFRESDPSSSPADCGDSMAKKVMKCGKVHKQAVRRAESTKSSPKNTVLSRARACSIVSSPTVATISKCSPNRWVV